MSRAGRRRLCIIGTVVLVGLVVWGFFVWRDLRAARSDLVTARKTLRASGDNPSSIRTAEGRAKAAQTLDSVRRDIDAAQDKLNHSPALAVARVVPGLASQRSGLLRLVSDSRA